LGTGDLNSFFRRPYGTGWALVGDAGYYKDPITAQGMTDAFLDAELVSEAGHQLIQHGDESAMERYEARRNARTAAMFQLTCDLAQLAKPNADMQLLFTALGSSQSDCNKFMGVVAGTVGVHEFFSPDNITRIIGEHQHRLRHPA
jgi:2-polyprenyl-6-methoxyphenol hydroxylase-like FAD-dependent oxidoreductase